MVKAVDKGEQVYNIGESLRVDSSKRDNKA